MPKVIKTPVMLRFIHDHIITCQQKSGAPVQSDGMTKLRTKRSRIWGTFSGIKKLGPRARWNVREVVLPVRVMMPEAVCWRLVKPTIFGRQPLPQRSAQPSPPIKAKTGCQSLLPLWPIRLVNYSWGPFVWRLNWMVTGPAVRQNFSARSITNVGDPNGMQKHSAPVQFTQVLPAISMLCKGMHQLCVV